MSATLGGLTIRTDMRVGFGWETDSWEKGEFSLCPNHLCKGFFDGHVPAGVVDTATHGRRTAEEALQPARESVIRGATGRWSVEIPSRLGERPRCAPSHDASPDHPGPHRGDADLKGSLNGREPRGVEA